MYKNCDNDNDDEEEDADCKWSSPAICIATCKVARGRAETLKLLGFFHRYPRGRRQGLPELVPSIDDI